MAYFPLEFRSSAGTHEVRIRLPRPRRTLVFMGSWLTLWTLVGSTVLAGWLARPAGQGHGRGLSAGWWLVFWAAGEVVMWGQLARILAGREVVTLAQGTLRIRQQLGPLHFDKTYAAAQIGYLRAQDEEALDQLRRQRRLPLTGGAVRFDYGPRTVEFGSGLSEADGNRVVDFLRQHGVAPMRR